MRCGGARGWLVCAGVVLALGCGADPQAPAPPPSIVLITLDTLRVDRVDMYGGRRRLTPNLAALAGRGLVFEHAFTTSPTTGPAHASLFTGLLPHEHGVGRNGQPLATRFEPQELAVRLRAAGYATGAFVSSGVLGRKVVRFRGFDVYDRPEPEHRPGAETVERALAWVSAKAAPIFLWVHLFDSHAPYGDAASRRDHKRVDKHRHGFIEPSRFESQRYRDRMADLYDRGVRDMDAAVGLLVDRLSEPPLAAKVGDVFYTAVADHGEALDERIDERSYAYDHGEFLDVEQIRIQLVLAGDGVGSGRHAGAVSIRDLYTTLLAAAGLADESAAGEGRRDLRGSAERGDDDRPRTVRAMRRNLRVRESEALGPESHAHIRSHRVAVTDGRSIAIVGEDGEPAPGSEKELVAEARSYLETITAAEAPTTDEELDPKTRAELEALGYID